MPWYLPFTVIPGVALLILSTSNIMLTLNAEISTLKKQPDDFICEIILLKLQQLKKLSYAISFLYVGTFLFFISGIAAFFFHSESGIGKYTLLSGVSFICISLLLLIIYSFKAVKIRQKHLLDDSFL